MPKKKTTTLTWNKQPIEAIKKPSLRRRLEVWWCGIGYPHYPAEYDFLRYCDHCGFDRKIQDIPICECKEIVRGKYCRSCGRRAPLTTSTNA